MPTWLTPQRPARNPPDDGRFGLVDALLDVRPLAVRRDDGDVVVPEAPPPQTWPARALRIMVSCIRCRACSRSISPA